MKTIKGYEKARKLLERSLPYNTSAQECKVEAAVRVIIDRVRREGDKALFAYTQRFDGARLQSLEVTKKERAAARLEGQRGVWLTYLASTRCTAVERRFQLSCCSATACRPRLVIW